MKSEQIFEPKANDDRKIGTQRESVGRPIASFYERKIFFSRALLSLYNYSFSLWNEDKKQNVFSTRKINNLYFVTTILWIRIGVYSKKRKRYIFCLCLDTINEPRSLSCFITKVPIGSNNTNEYMEKRRYLFVLCALDWWWSSNHTHRKCNK